MLSQDSSAFLPFFKNKASYIVSGNKVNGSVEVDANGTVIFNINSGRSDPNQFKNFNNLMFPPRNIYNPLFYSDKVDSEEYRSPPIKIKMPTNYSERNAEVGLLRVAYLIAYSTFGSGFLMSGNLHKIREQILNPDKDIIPRPFGVSYPIGSEFDGVNIITEPKEAQCFLVVFNLKTKSRTQQFSIALPGPGDAADKVYNYIQNKLCVGDGSETVKITREHIPRNDYIKKKNLAFASQLFWRKYTGPGYKPNFKVDEKVI